MTENESMNSQEQNAPPHDSSEGDRSSDPLGGLLKSALADPPAPPRSFLPGIQQRIRIRTKGRYYRDRWSTARDPVSLLLMIALLLLILATALFLVMQPLMEAAQETQLPTPAVDPLATEKGPTPTIDTPATPEK